jgi:hypothetical protein
LDKPHRLDSDRLKHVLEFLEAGVDFDKPHRGDSRGQPESPERARCDSPGRSPG